MRFRQLFVFLIISLFLFISCESETKKGELVNSSTSLESPYSKLDQFQWLSDFGNYQDSTYLVKFNQEFEGSLQEKNWEDAAAYLIAYGISAKQTQTLDSAYVLKATEFFEKNADKISGEAKSTLGHYIAAQYKNIHQFDKATEWFEKTFEYAPETASHSQAIGLSHLLLGQIHLEQRELPKAEKQIISSLTIFEGIGDAENQGKAYLLMHNLYVRNLAHEKAEMYLEKAIEIFEKEKSDFYAFTAHIFYVQYHLEKADTVNGIRQIDKMAKFSKSYTGITDYHKGFLNQFLAYKYISQKKEDSAAYHLGELKEIADRTGIPDLKMRNFFTEVSFASQFDKELKNIEEAEMYYEYLASLETPNIQNMYQLASSLYDYYKLKGEYKKADYFGEFLIGDGYRQHAARMENQLFELETKYETEKKERTILQQEQKIEQKNKTIIYLVLATVLILLVFLLVFIWAKNKSILKEKVLTENFTSQLLMKTENERKRIASDLHDSVSNELVNLRHVIENKDDLLKGKIDLILEEVRNISRNISPAMFDKVGLKLSVEQLTERIQNQDNFFISSEIDYKGGLSSDKELQLYRMIQEAITNILKHANAVAGKVTITETAEFVMVEIKDNGQGFDVDKTFEEGNSFGLLNIRERAKHLKGTVSFRSESTGTIIQIQVPK